MLTEVTSGIRISVEPRYEPSISSPLMDSFVFSYSVTIENQSDVPVQLMRRHWFIFDSCAMKREVEGPGVVGETPIIAPGEFFTYSSACDLRSFRGSMHGFYTMKKDGDEKLFSVRIPKFLLEVPYSSN